MTPPVGGPLGVRWGPVGGPLEHPGPPRRAVRAGKQYNYSCRHVQSWATFSCYLLTDLLDLSLFTPGGAYATNDSFPPDKCRAWASSSVNLFSAFDISASIYQRQVFLAFPPFPFALRVRCERLSHYVLCWLPDLRVWPL